MTHLTMTDIARAAGVSLTTVGRVVRKSGYVSEEKRVAVERVIRETGYVPNRIARGLKSNRMNLIGHITVLNPNMLYEQISKSLNDAASREGFQTLTYTVDWERVSLEIVLDELIGHRVDGIVITSHPRLDEELLHKVITRAIPLVMIERTLALEGTDRIVVADYEGAFQAVDHLISRGHDNIAYAGKIPDHEVEKRRLEGYRQALNNAGISSGESLVYLTDNYGVEEGRQAAEVLLELNPRPTAVFMTSDLFICGFLQVCYERKLRIPEDISLVGYDNTLSMMLSPPITSIRLELSTLGGRAMDLLKTRKDNPGLPSREVQSGTALVERESVKRINYEGRG
ncbi:MAG: LacI family DNA-binding transcriptional regulator [Spirochaetales bacterium]|nr:LacI family DNA-binding transcriptional regulator [Spirochaetales bacterium]